MNISHTIGNDLDLTNYGALRLVQGLELSNQRILRRLLTAVRGYIWDLSYGAGLPEQIGQILTPTRKSELIGRIKSQMFLESTVVQSPQPEVTLTSDIDVVNVQIKYTYKTSGQIVVLSFQVSNT